MKKWAKKEMGKWIGGATCQEEVPPQKSGFSRWFLAFLAGIKLFWVVLEILAHGEEAELANLNAKLGKRLLTLAP